MFLCTVVIRNKFESSLFEALEKKYEIRYIKFHCTPSSRTCRNWYIFLVQPIKSKNPTTHAPNIASSAILICCCTNALSQGIFFCLFWMAPWNLKKKKWERNSENWVTLKKAC